MNAIMNFIEAVIKVTVKELEAILLPITKSTIVSVIYIVDDSRSKQVKGQKQVQKVVECTNVFLNHKYENKVRNLTGDATFVADELKGKSRVCGTLLRSDKTGELMLDGKILKTETTKILAYMHNGEFISEADAIAMDLWAGSYYNPTPKTTMGRGSVDADDDFGIINPYLCRIHKIKIDGQWYEITK